MQRVVSLIVIALLLGSGNAIGDEEIERNSVSTASVYQVDATSSDIRLLTYRAGVLSKLGHNHIISIGQLTGSIHVHTDLAQSGFELEIPVKELLVDDALRRREEGEDFASEPSERDIVGTRRNMLGKRLLNAEIYPMVRVTGTGPKTDGAGFKLELSIELLGRVVEISVPTTVRIEGDVLEATGSVPLSHKDLGLRPFSAMFGSLRVADQMNLKYHVRAIRAPANY